ncbi:hypothetical protein C8R44DRAFT_879150 [Mycena epipterygia]|nr:hypothetical protein C8R44DRAFT_879150 [Mycena epipterygia]
MPNDTRFGRLTQKSIDKFRSLSRPIEYADGLGPTELFPRRKDVHRSNSGRMNRLTSKVETFKAADGGVIQDLAPREKMLAHFMAVETLYFT